MKYKLLALDVDGTLLNDEHEITETTRKTIEKVLETGTELVLCTGRGPFNTLPLMEKYNWQGTVITHNGAVTIKSTNQQIVHQYSFPVQEVRNLLFYCRENDLHFDMCTPFTLYAEKVSEYIGTMYEKFDITPKMIPDAMQFDEPLVKFTLFDEVEKIDQVERLWDEIDCSLNKIRSGSQFIDVMHPDANKGNALHQYALSLGIQREEIIAMGNYFNDIEMLEYAGIGIAMGNSPEAVKERADFVTATNNEDGVHLALAQYFFSKV